MRRKNITFILMICLIAAPIIATGVEPVHIPDGVEMIVWEHQNWETNGGFEMLHEGNSKRRSGRASISSNFSSRDLSTGAGLEWLSK